MYKRNSYLTNCRAARKKNLLRAYLDMHVTNEAYDFVEIPEYRYTREEILQTEAAKGNNLIIFLDDFQVYILWYYTLGKWNSLHR